MGKELITQGLSNYWVLNSTKTDIRVWAKSQSENLQKTWMFIKDFYNTDYVRIEDLVFFPDSKVGLIMDDTILEMISRVNRYY